MPSHKISKDCFGFCKIKYARSKKKLIAYQGRSIH